MQDVETAESSMGCLRRCNCSHECSQADCRGFSSTTNLWSSRRLGVLCFVFDVGQRKTIFEAITEANGMYAPKEMSKKQEEKAERKCREQQVEASTAPFCQSTPLWCTWLCPAAIPSSQA